MLESPNWEKALEGLLGWFCTPGQVALLWCHHLSPPPPHCPAPF